MVIRVEDILQDGVTYARSVFKFVFTGAPLHRPALLNRLQLDELHHLAIQMALGMSHPLVLEWDSKSYYDVVRAQDGGNASAEDRFTRQFPPIQRPGLDAKPLTVWDQAGRAELWYIPNAISQHRQAVIQALIRELNPLLSKRGPRGLHGNWRGSDEYFRDPEFCKEFNAGVLNIALAWQMQGHENYDADIYPSKDFAKKGRPQTAIHRQTQSFVEGLSTTTLLVSAALAIAHPEQYDVSCECIRQIAQYPGFADLASIWALAFNVITVVVNRSTPLHRDTLSGGHGLLDALLTIGGGPHTVLEFPGLGLRLQYDSGTMVLFAGHVHCHGASVSRQERICLAFYARKAMFHKFSLKLPDPASVETILTHAGQVPQPPYP